MTHRCPTCQQPVEGPAYDAREAGYDAARHCVLLANNLGKNVSCRMISEIGYMSCHRCQVYRNMVEEVKDKHGRTHERIKQKAGTGN